MMRKWHQQDVLSSIFVSHLFLTFRSVCCDSLIWFRTWIFVSTKFKVLKSISQEPALAFGSLFLILSSNNDVVSLGCKPVEIPVTKAPATEIKRSSPFLKETDDRNSWFLRSNYWKFVFDFWNNDVVPLACKPSKSPATAIESRLSLIFYKNLLQLLEVCFCLLPETTTLYHWPAKRFKSPRQHYHRATAIERSSPFPKEKNDRNSCSLGTS